MANRKTASVEGKIKTFLIFKINLTHEQIIIFLFVKYYEMNGFSRVRKLLEKRPK